MAFCCGAPDIDDEDECNVRHVRKSILYIEENAGSGDVFFASGAGIWSDVVRKLAETTTWSHIGIFIRDTDNKLYIFDVDLDGVKILPFNEYRKIYDGYYFGLRKLTKVTTSDRVVFTRILLKMSGDMSGLPYSSAEKLFYSLSRENGEDWDEKRRFFCVQLVVECYKKLDLIDPDSEQSSNAQLLDFLSVKNGVNFYAGKITLDDVLYYATT